MDGGEGNFIVIFVEKKARHKLIHPLEEITMQKCCKNSCLPTGHIIILVVQHCNFFKEKKESLLLEPLSILFNEGLLNAKINGMRNHVVSNYIIF